MAVAGTVPEGAVLSQNRRAARSGVPPGSPGLGRSGRRVDLSGRGGRGPNPADFGPTLSVGGAAYENTSNGRFLDHRGQRG